MARYEVEIPGWRPATLNELAESVRQRMQLKRLDREVIALYVRVRARVPMATGRRRVGLRLSFAPGERRPDVDAFWKSYLDALKQNGLLVDDGPKYCEVTPVEYDAERLPGGARSVVILEDLDRGGRPC